MFFLARDFYFDSCPLFLFAFVACLSGMGSTARFGIVDSLTFSDPAA